MLTAEFLRCRYLDEAAYIIDIARETGASPALVGAYLDLHGIPRRSGPPPSRLSAVLTREFLEERLADGMSYSAIGREAGCSGQSVHAWAQRHGLL